MIVDRKLKQKFWNKRTNARAENIEFDLTLDEFVGLMIEAKISINDLHIKGYHLSRDNDQGPYKIGNCRFKYYLDNYAEKKVSDKARKASAENLQKYRETK